jgi:DNA helicase Pif1-like protein
MLMHHLPGEQRTYYSVDSAINDAGEIAQEATSEFLRTVDVPGIPPSVLSLKVGAPVMLMRNMNPRVGLCNGTRLIITRLGRKVIEGRILTGDHKGSLHCIPRIPLSLRTVRSSGLPPRVRCWPPQSLPPPFPPSMLPPPAPPPAGLDNMMDFLVRKPLSPLNEIRGILVLRHTIARCLLIYVTLALAAFGSEFLGFSLWRVCVEQSRLWDQALKEQIGEA